MEYAICRIRYFCSENLLKIIRFGVRCRIMYHRYYEKPNSYIRTSLRSQTLLFWKWIKVCVTVRISHFATADISLEKVDFLRKAKVIVFAALPGLIECSFPGWWWQTTANGPRPPPSTKGTTKNSLLDRPFLPQLKYCIFLFTFDLWWCLFGRTASSRSTGKFNISLFVPNQHSWVNCLKGPR